MKRMIEIGAGMLIGFGISKSIGGFVFWDAPGTELAEKSLALSFEGAILMGTGIIVLMIIWAWPSMKQLLRHQ